MRGPLYNLSYFRVGYPVLNNMRLRMEYMIDRLYWKIRISWNIKTSEPVLLLTHKSRRFAILYETEVGGNESPVK